MNNIKAIGFDLFNTLITADLVALNEAMHRLTESLGQSGFQLELDSFKKAYRESAIRFMNEARLEGKETHNRFWISSALVSLGHAVSPDDASISRAVEAYFSNSFFDTVLVSGVIGYRKPHPLVFKMLVENLGYENHQIVYVGDSLDPDVLGAIRSGLKPIWMTYVQDHHLPVMPSIPSEQNEILTDQVPRVSDWDGLLSLLKET
jgi:FMN phosphatase YigB (HAD superfamily)